MNYRVLVSDNLAEAGLAPLVAATDLDVDIRTGLTPEDLISVIGDYDALLVRSATKATAEVIRAGKNLRVIGRAGVGVDNIDIEAATQSGVIVVNAPTGNVVAAAEHTIAMLMAAARNIPQANSHVREGLWKRNQFVGIEVRNKVLGSIGLGRIAQEVTQRANALGMDVIAYDPYVTAEYASQRSVELVELAELLQRSDFITCHVPLTDQTRNLINAEKLQTTKPGVRILNVSRGGVIDEAALANALDSGHVAAAALDVFAEEPLASDNPLLACDNVIFTPHLGGSTVEAQEKVAVDVALQVIDVLNDRPARYAVNAPIIPPSDLDFLVPYIDLAERLGSFVRQLGAQGTGDLEIIAHGHLADFDLAYIDAAVIKGLLAGVVDTRVNLVNALLLAKRRGLNLNEVKQQQQLDVPYETMLTVCATSDSRRWTVRGAMLMGEPHIVAINEQWIDFPASGSIVLTSHVDAPGIIGRVGTMLGTADVNISFMHVGRRAPRTDAIMALGTDEVAPASILQELNELDQIIWLNAVTLE